MADLDPRWRWLVGGGGAALLVAFLAFVAHGVFGLGGGGLDAVFDTWVYDGLMVGAAASCFVRALLIPRERRAWFVIGLGLLVWTAGEIYYSLAFAGTESVPIPSLADAGYLAFYPLAYVGLAMLLRQRVGAISGGQWLDGAIVGSAVAALAAALAMDPIVAASTSGSFLAVATNLAYPIGDLTLLTLLTTAFAFTDWRPGISWLTLALGLALLAVSDGLYLVQSAQETYVEGGILDAAWPFGALLLGAAAWLPPGRRRFAEARTLRTALIPAAAALLAVLLQFANAFASVPLLAEVLSLVTLLCVIVRMTLSFREAHAHLESSTKDATTDALTGLGNRRQLLADLGSAGVLSPAAGKLCLFVLFDLNGFKGYNDAFGHPAGDSLLARLGTRLAAFAGAQGAAYRLGGDEFCLLVECTATEVDGQIAGAAAALSERGDGFVVSASHGEVLLPSEATSPEAALQLADGRMYTQKNGGRNSAGTQSRDVLISALRERRPELLDHLTDVATFASEVASELGMSVEERDEVVRAAELHDTGKMAIPDAILNKPGPLDEEELKFMRRHPLIGERIIGSAPALAPVAKLVRSTRERWDGKGYPDGLTGEEAPLGSRIVAVCEAYGEMLEGSPYHDRRTPAAALQELQGFAGSRFDPRVVAALVAVSGVRGAAEGRTPGKAPAPSPATLGGVSEAP